MYCDTLVADGFGAHAQHVGREKVARPRAPAVAGAADAFVFVAGKVIGEIVRNSLDAGCQAAVEELPPVPANAIDGLLFQSV